MEINTSLLAEIKRNLVEIFKSDPFTINRLQRSNNSSNARRILNSLIGFPSKHKKSVTLF